MLIAIDGRGGGVLAAAITCVSAPPQAAEVLPEDKANDTRQLQMDGKFTAMVGDGVNNAPELGEAGLGLVNVGGTDIAVRRPHIFGARAVWPTPPRGAQSPLAIRRTRL